MALPRIVRTAAGRERGATRRCWPRCYLFCDVKDGSDCSLLGVIGGMQLLISASLARSGNFGIYADPCVLFFWDSEADLSEDILLNDSILVSISFCKVGLLSANR